MASNSPPGGTRSQMGTQVSSKKVSAPIYGFGSGTRDGRAKLFISQEHAAVAGPGPGGSPGPATYTQAASVGPQVNGALESSPRWRFGSENRFPTTKKADMEAPAPGKYDTQGGVGPQVQSHKTSMPLFGFGSSTRDHQENVYKSEEHNKALFGRGSPGPSSYTLNPAVGKQVLSSGPSPYSTGSAKSVVNGTQPAWVMGKAERFNGKNAAGAVPGPGAYTITPAVGNQVSSMKPSLPRFGFGTSTRDNAAKVYISAEHEKVMGSSDAPGPGTYVVKSMTGEKVASSTKVRASHPS